MSKKGSKSTLTFMHQISQKSVVDGKVVVHEEYIADGEKGLLIKHYHKEGDNKSKFIAKTNSSGTFDVKIIENDDFKEHKDVTKAELLKMVAKDKNLEFAKEYLKKLKGGKRGSKKGSKKGSKRGSKRGSKKGSRKGSKRGSRKGSRK